MAQLLMQRRFTGINTYLAPQDLDDHQVQQADNLISLGGEFVTRPGKQGLFASALGNPIYEPLPYIKADGNTRIFFVTGGTSNGQLYYADKGTWTPTVVSGTTTNIVSNGARMARVGGYGYLVDGANPLVRFDATTGASAVTGETTPTAAPSAALANTIKDALSTSTGLAGDLIAANYAYTDLVIGTPNTHVSSAARPFTLADVGKSLNITSGTGFNVGALTVSSVTAGVATLSGAAGTIGSTAGNATLPQPASGENLIPTSQTAINATAYNGPPDPAAGTVIGPWTALDAAASIFLAGGGRAVPNDYLATATRWFGLDDPNSGYRTAFSTSALQSPVLAAPNGDRRCCQFLFSANYYTSDTRSLQGLKIIVDGYGVISPTVGVDFPVATQSFTYIMQYAGQQAGQAFSHVFSLASLTNILSIVVSVVGADSNVNAAQFSNWGGFPCCANMVIAAIDNRITFSPATTGLTVNHRESSLAGEQSSAYWGKIGGIRLTKDYGSNQDWSTSNVIAVSLSAAPGGKFTVQQLIDSGLSMCLGFRPNGSTTHSLSNIMTFSTDGTYAFVDVSTIASTVRAAFQYLEIIFLRDVSVASTTDPLVTIGPITFAGNLSIGEAAYNWVFEEVNATPSALTVSAATNATPIQITTTTAHGFVTGDTVSVEGVTGNTAANGVWQVAVVSTTAFTLTSSVGNSAYVSGGTVYSFVNTVESGESPVSNSLDPTGLKAEGNVVLPAPINGNATHFYIYRFGGVFPQGDSFTTYRLVAIVPKNIDATSGSNTYWTWNHTTRTLVDNTPDSSLFGVSTLISGRETPPTAAQAITQWQNRMWLAQGSTLYGSWLLTQSASAALYFSSYVDQQNDPNALIKGGKFEVGGADNDNIVALVPLGPMLIIIKSRSVWMLTGTDGSNFQLSQHLYRAGVGCVAPRAVALVQNHLWFLAGDGVWEYDGGELIQPKSVEIEPLLTPGIFNQTAIPATYFANCAMLYAGKRLYLFAPKDANATGNTVAYVYDARTEGWTRFLSMNITSACTTAGSRDDSEIYLAGSDGQLYQLTGQGDKALSGSAATAVPFTFVSRGMGQEQADISYWTTNIPSVLLASVTTGESAALTFRVIGDVGSGYSRTYNVNGKAQVRFPDVTTDAHGDYVAVGVSGSTVTRSKVTSVAVTIQEGQPSTL